MDATTLSKILGGFLDADTEVRRQAEASFQDLKSEHPDALAVLLCQVLEQDGIVTRRQQAAVSFRNFLREFFLSQPGNAWEKMQVSSQDAVKAQILQRCFLETSEIVKKAVSDIVVDLGDILLQKGSWPELPVAIDNMLQHEDTKVQVVGLEIAASLEPNLSSTLLSNLPGLTNMLTRKIETRNPDICAATASLISQIVINESREVSQQLEIFILPLIQMVGFCEASADKQATSILRSLIEVAVDASEWFKQTASSSMPLLVQLAKSEEPSDDVRQLSMELILTFIENKHKTASKLPGFLESVLDTLLTFLLEVEEDTDWFSRDLSGEDDEEAKNYEVGEYGLDRIASAVDSDIIMPMIFQRVGEYIISTSWKARVAGIIAICQTGEYMSEDKIEAQLGDVIKMLISKTTDEHYRVRFAACRALAQVALDHQPFAQENFHQLVLPAVVQRFDDPVARVQGQAFAAFINYAEEVDVEDLIQYIPVTMEKIFLRLSPTFVLTPTTAGPEPHHTFTRGELDLQHRFIGEQCITSVAVIAGVLSEKFLEFCPKVLPFMKDIVHSCVTPETRPMRGRALECLSIIAYSVGYHQVENDTNQIIQALIQLYKTDDENSGGASSSSSAGGPSADDPVRDYVYEALRRMTSVMGKNFGKFVEELVPSILKNLHVDPTNVDVTQESAEDFSIVCSTGNVFSGVKTSKLDAMEKDLQLLTWIIDSTKGLFTPFIPDTMAVIIPLLQLKHSDNVRRLSLLTVAELIGAARDGQASSPEQICKWVLDALDVVLKCVGDDTELLYSGVDHLTGNVAGLARCLDNAGPNVLTSEHVRYICHTAWTFIEQSSKRRLVLEESKKKVDEEEAEEVDDERDREQTFRETCVKVFESVMRHHPNEFLESAACLETIENVKIFIDPNRPADDRSLACYVCCDFLEHLGPRGLNLIITNDILPKIILYLHDENPGLRQGACYAINLCMATDTPSGVVSSGITPELVASTAARLVQIIKHPNANQRENKSATENAISALFTICLKNSGSGVATTSPQLVGEWARLILDKLPLSVDEEEAIRVHKKFVQTLLENDQSIFWTLDTTTSPISPASTAATTPSSAGSAANLTKIVCIVAQIYKTPQSDDANDANIRQLVKKIGLPNVAMIVNNSNITDTQRRGLKKIERDFETPVSPQH